MLFKKIAKSEGSEFKKILECFQLIAQFEGIDDIRRVAAEIMGFTARHRFCLPCQYGYWSRIDRSAHRCLLKVRLSESPSIEYLSGLVIEEVKRIPDTGSAVELETITVDECWVEYSQFAYFIFKMHEILGEEDGSAWCEYLEEVWPESGRKLRLMLRHLNNGDQDDKPTDELSEAKKNGYLMTIACMAKALQEKNPTRYTDRGVVNRKAIADDVSKFAAYDDGEFVTSMKPDTIRKRIAEGLAVLEDQGV